MGENVTLVEAREKVRRCLRPAGRRIVPLQQAVGRVVSSSIYAKRSNPGYNQSTYDGYVISKQPSLHHDVTLQFALAGEIAAGDMAKQVLSAKSAYRIMTGAAVPVGSWKVIPQEFCDNKDGYVTIPGAAILRGASNIKRTGSLRRKGALLIRSGEYITPAQLGILADGGYEEVEIFTRPKVAFYCSGSELVNDPGHREEGKKVSSNRYLLAGLLEQAGCANIDCGVVADERARLTTHLKETVQRDSDMIISTGGMGPGKYDLIEEMFRKHGGKIIFSAMKLRPGKSTLFGMIGNTLYFGLPGPPMAVHAMFHALVLPAIRAMQGMRRWKPPIVKAFLEKDLAPGKNEVFRLHQAVLSTNRGMVYVRVAERNELANSYLLCPPRGRKGYRKGDLMTVQPFVSH